MSFSIAIHGGAGVISKTDTDSTVYLKSLEQINDLIFKFAEESLPNDGIQAIDIVEFGVRLLEDEELFNAGRGAVFTSHATHELEASIMDGQTLKCGAASLITLMKNPVSVARVIMEDTPHIYMVGSEAEKVAINRGLEQVPSSYFSTARRLQHLRDAQATNSIINDHDSGTPFPSSPHIPALPTGTGTVGCVCFYKNHVAAATSTGGMTNKSPGRIGDTPIIGAGNYANDATCAVSATGKGEVFIQHVVGYDISAQMLYGGGSLEAACMHTVHNALPTGSGGVIAVDKTGNISLVFNSLGMFRGYCKVTFDSCGSPMVEKGVGIWEDIIITTS